MENMYATEWQLRLQKSYYPYEAVRAFFLGFITPIASAGEGIGERSVREDWDQDACAIERPRSCELYFHAVCLRSSDRAGFHGAWVQLSFAEECG